MDCCQLEEHIAHRQVKREELNNSGNSNDPENGSSDVDQTGRYFMNTFSLFYV